MATARVVWCLFGGVAAVALADPWRVWACAEFCSELWRRVARCVPQGFRSGDFSLPEAHWGSGTNAVAVVAAKKKERSESGNCESCFVHSLVFVWGSSSSPWPTLVSVSVRRVLFGVVAARGALVGLPQLCHALYTFEHAFETVLRQVNQPSSSSSSSSSS